MKLYRIFETEYYGEDGCEVRHYLITNYKACNYQSYERPGYKVVYEAVPLLDSSDATLEELCNAIESAMENANLHHFTGIAAWFSTSMANCGVKEDTIKEIIWNMVSEKGLEWYDI